MVSTYEVWKCSDESVMWCGHTPERRRQFQSGSDVLIGRIEVSGDEEVSDKVALISADFEEHGEAIATASDILTSTYPNGLTAGEIIELTQDADIGWSQLPSGTRLRIEHGDSDFPEVLYASTEKWPTGKGRNHHLRFVMLDTKELGQSYRRHTGTTRKREQDEMRRQRGMRERILSGAREVSAAALEG